MSYGEDQQVNCSKKLVQLLQNCDGHSSCSSQCGWYVILDPLIENDAAMPKRRAAVVWTDFKRCMSHTAILPLANCSSPVGMTRTNWKESIEPQEVVIVAGRGVASAECSTIDIRSASPCIHPHGSNLFLFHLPSSSHQVPILSVARLPTCPAVCPRMCWKGHEANLHSECRETWSGGDSVTKACLNNGGHYSIPRFLYCTWLLRRLFWIGQWSPRRKCGSYVNISTICKWQRYDGILKWECKCNRGQKADGASIFALLTPSPPLRIGRDA